MTINYNQPIVQVSGDVATVTSRPASIDLYRMEDLPNERVVRLYVSDQAMPVTAWEGDAYDSIGQWTDTQASGRCVEILESAAPIIVRI